MLVAPVAGVAAVEEDAGEGADEEDEADVDVVVVRAVVGAADDAADEAVVDEAVAAAELAEVADDADCAFPAPLPVAADSVVDAVEAVVGRCCIDAVETG